MIPIARGIPSLSGPTGTPPHHNDAQAQSQQQAGAFQAGGNVGQGPLFGRRRSSIDNILENLKFVGAFPSRLMADFSQPHNHSNQSSTSSLFSESSHASLTRLPSFTELGATQQQNQPGATPNFAAAGTKPATDKKKFPSAEEFLTF
ncbi:hypothetical protein HK097_004190 [Rhizophlyctis rosea]|uniref:Uncharacterized protein n=1 Tax=Rhizophlyctis rosea TaxID=64517 RepID=A0AAD5X2U9_9FUNG|nr:hypothetical protein HK097_004190 [Rhizophlyctis rosea]